MLYFVDVNQLLSELREILQNSGLEIALEKVNKLEKTITSKIDQIKINYIKTELHSYDWNLKDFLSEMIYRLV